MTFQPASSTKSKTIALVDAFWMRFRGTESLLVGSAHFWWVRLPTGLEPQPRVLDDSHHIQGTLKPWPSLSTLTLALARQLTNRDFHLQEALVYVSVQR